MGTNAAWYRAGKRALSGLTMQIRHATVNDFSFEKERPEAFQGTQITEIRRKDSRKLFGDSLQSPPTGQLSMLAGKSQDERWKFEQSYLLMFEANPLPMWVYDLDTLCFLDVNEAAVQHYGYSREEFLSMTIAAIRPSEDVPRLLAGIEPDREGRRSAGVWRHCKKDGSIIDVEIVAHPVPFAGRRAGLILAIDVTELLRSQAEMAERSCLAAMMTEVCNALGMAKALREGLQQCAEVLVRDVDSGVARIWTLNHSENVLELQASAGMNHQVAEAANGGPVGLTEFPLKVENRVLGVVEVFLGPSLTQAKIQALESVASSIGQFIERKKAEEALRDSEERVRLLLDSTAEAIYGIDLNGNCTLANRACLRMLGYEEPGDLLGKNMHSLMHHNHADGSPYLLSDCRIYRAFKNEEECHVDDEVLWRADGTSFPAEYWSYPMRKGGKIVGAVVTFLDMTQRRQAEEEQRKLVSLIETSDDFIGMASPELKVSYLNNGGCELVGMENSRQALGQDISRFHSESSWARIQEEALPTVLNTGSWEGEVQLRHFKTGAPIDAWMHAFLVRRPETGEIQCLATVTRDITERKRAEESLRQAKEAAEAANRAKSQFLANMSHEIRTPMNGIIGMTELALETELTSEQREYLSIVQTSADSLLKIINDILDFSKIEARKLDLENIAFPLRDHVEATVQALLLPARQKNLELQCRFEPEVPQNIVGDAGRLKQILVNLLGNAIKFTESGTVRLQVEASRIAEKPVLHFSVADTGIGIPLEKRETIFQAFTQADDSFTRRYGGTGLGLAIASQLAQLMGGRIWVETELGKGSTFHFTIPLAACEEATERAGAERRLASTPSRTESVA
jgi:PAS domain S-box-containing protein